MQSYLEAILRVVLLYAFVRGGKVYVSEAYFSFLSVNVKFCGFLEVHKPLRQTFLQYFPQIFFI